MKKSSAISPSLTQCRSDTVIPTSAEPTVTWVSQKRS